MTDFATLFGELRRYAASHGVVVRCREMDAETPAEFDGFTITLNSIHDIEARCYYLVHSFGSIVAWSVDGAAAERVFRELREAKASRKRDPDRLERALQHFNDFEEQASEYAVWVLATVGFEHVVPQYTEFFRADAASMTVLHREGSVPPWPEFFRTWKARVNSGQQKVEPYSPRPVPAFRPVRIRKQEVVQEIDGR